MGKVERVGGGLVNPVTETQKLLHNTIIQSPSHDLLHQLYNDLLRIIMIQVIGLSVNELLETI